MTVRYCGRYFTPAELDLIQGLIKAQPTREAIARAMCIGRQLIPPPERFVRHLIPPPRAK